MGFEADWASSSSTGESVIVVTDASRSKGNLEAVEWALKHVVRPKDRVVVLAVLREFGKKTSCFPFHMGIGIAGIWEKLEFSGSAQTELDPRELEEEIEKKREQYQCSLQPFYQQCKKNEVKLEVKLAAGFEPCKITVEEAQNSNTRWIVLDSHLKEGKVFIYGHVGCNVAVMKGKDAATLMLSKTVKIKSVPKIIANNDDIVFTANKAERLQDEVFDAPQEVNSSTAAPILQSPCCYPLSWRTGFPQAFTQSELEVITHGFADENVAAENEQVKVYLGILQETPVLVKFFSRSNEQVWSEFKILSQVCHRNILNLVGYCCEGPSVFLVFDLPCLGTLARNLQCDELAKNLPWKARWHIALEIGGCLRYLHEECINGPIVHLSVGSSSVLISHSGSAMLGNFLTAEWLEDDMHCNEDSRADCPNLDNDERLFVDVHGYGMLLIELITGKTAKGFQGQGEAQSFIDWASQVVENGSLTQVMDARLKDTNDTNVVNHMAHAAVLCLKNESSCRLSISEALSVVQGDEIAISTG